MDDSSPLNPRHKLLELHDALITLRDELHRINLALHDHALHLDHPAARDAKEEADLLLRRLRR